MCQCELNVILSVIINSHSNCAPTVIVRLPDALRAPSSGDVSPDPLGSPLSASVFVESAAITASDLQTSHEQLQRSEAQTRQAAHVCVCVFVAQTAAQLFSAVC